jgi:hypothetical protein
MDRASIIRSAAALPFPDTFVVEWVREGGLHIQWRDRAGFSPASLLCPAGHRRHLFDFHKTERTAPAVSNGGAALSSTVSRKREAAKNLVTRALLDHPYTRTQPERITMQKAFIVSLGVAGLIGVASIAAAAEPPAAKADAPKAEAPKAPSPEAVAAGKKIDWAKMDEKAKKKYMKTTVLPQMKKLFVAFDKKHYSNMSCQTCHGEKAVENKFKMPNPSLPKLPQPTDRAGFMAVQQKKPEAVKFMGTEVKPTMAALLGKAEWSPTNPEGFGCYQCHTKEDGPAAPPAAGKPATPPPAAPAPSKGW